jgi:hypothetical protein
MFADVRLASMRAKLLLLTALVAAVATPLSNLSAHDAVAPASA